MARSKVRVHCLVNMALSRTRTANITLQKKGKYFNIFLKLSQIKIHFPPCRHNIILISVHGAIFFLLQVLQILTIIE